MPANKNALIRYKTIDNCLRNPYRRWTIEDLVDACCDALYEAEGISKGVSLRTVQADIQMMRSDKLGFNAPIEVYDKRFYRYADRDYSIMNLHSTRAEYEAMKEVVDMLRELEGFGQFAEMSDMLGRLQDKLAISQGLRKPIIHFDRVPDLRGLRLLNPLYNYIANRQTLSVTYRSFRVKEDTVYTVFPYLLKEFRNRWFLYACDVRNMKLFNFALDRIVSVEPRDIPYRDNPSFDTEHFFDDLIGVSKSINQRSVTVTFSTSPERTPYVLTKPLHRSQRLQEERDDGSAVFTIDVVPNLELYSVFMSYGTGIQVLSPESVRRVMRDRLRRAAALYDDGEP